jgi:hypothetical protein
MSRSTAHLSELRPRCDAIACPHRLSSPAPLRQAQGKLRGDAIPKPRVGDCFGPLGLAMTFEWRRLLRLRLAMTCEEGRIAWPRNL